MKIVVMLCDIRSCYNVGSILRTADGAGVSKLICGGITPYPRLREDSRPEHVIASNAKMIHKTALGAEVSVEIEHADDPLEAIARHKKLGYQIVALENKVPDTVDLFEFEPKQKAVLVLGSETEGLSSEILQKCDAVVEIPMRGQKNSLNVSVAAGIALYQLLR